MDVISHYGQTVEEFSQKTMEHVCQKVSEILAVQMQKLVHDIDVQVPAPSTLVFNNRETVLGNLRAVATMLYVAADENNPARLTVEVLVNDRLVVVIAGTSNSDELTYQLATGQSGTLDVTIADILLIKMAVDNIG